MTDREIDDLWLEAFKASSDDGRVRQRFAELCYQKGAAEMKERCAEVCESLAGNMWVTREASLECSDAIRARKLP
jgi:hypothetical protein